ncbi:MAG: nitrogenase component 1 [Lachnospiraceae bacterium]|nr:nitrogenase component 1 [Lachnospiraceae bacterium]
MQMSVKSPRNGCALHGALQAVEAIRKAVPIVHSNPGCAIQNELAARAAGAGKGWIGDSTIPGTGVQERHIIFGGASRLREQIKNTVKVIDGELYVVLNSCASAMVGDDVGAMTKESREQGEPVVDCLTAGFHGDGHYGYSRVMTELLQKVPQLGMEAPEKNEKSVNLLGILPGRDVCFRGNLEELKRILEGVGLEVRTFFGAENGVEELKKAPGTGLNLVFSKWGQEAAEKMEQLYGIPYLTFPSVPVGILEVRNMLLAVAERLGIQAEVAESFLQKEEERFRYYFRPVLEELYEENTRKSIGLVGDESTVTAAGAFLREYFGAVIKTAVITDYFGAGNAAEKRKELPEDFAEDVYFTQDQGEISGILEQSEIDLLLGSSLEREIAGKKHIPLLELSYPVYDKAALGRTYAGINGAVRLAEDYLTLIKRENRKKENELLQTVRDRTFIYKVKPSEESF